MSGNVFLRKITDHKQKFMGSKTLYKRGKFTSVLLCVGMLFVIGSKTLYKRGKFTSVLLCVGMLFVYRK